MPRVCVRACPQRAKQIRDDLQTVRDLIGSGQRVIASVAPSAPAFLDVDSFGEIRALLQRLGFADASETALGAEIVSGEYSRLLSFGDLPARPLIATACPVIVCLVEKYHPDLVGHLAPVVSPMVAHGRWLKARQGSAARVVFVGPCAAKKGEAAVDEVRDAVDAVLTFAELSRWMVEAGVTLQPGEWAEVPEAQPARLYPVAGGLSRAPKLNTDLLATETVTATGLSDSEELLAAIRSGTLHASLAELMACREGCTNGPVMPEAHNVFVRRERILRFARQREAASVEADGVNLRRGYRDRSHRQSPIPPEVIGDLLARIEKYSPEDELNCSACGYNSCREKAEATYRGMAEIAMCMPYMRRRAESLANLVMDVVPSAVVVLDYQLRIQEASPSAELLLGCRRQQAVGRSLSEFIPTTTFQKVRSLFKPILGRKKRYRDDLIVKEFVVPVSRSNLIVGIIEDVTREERQQAS